MPVIWLFFSLTGAAVFYVSGTSKLLDQTQTRHTLREFGLPASLAQPAALMLPLTELAAGTALLIPGLARWGAWGILLLLLLFTAVITISLARGIRPACHCFGQLSDSPISWRTLLRNALLIGMTVLLIWAGPETGPEMAWEFLAGLSPLQWLAAGGSVAFLLVVSMQFWFLWQLWWQNGRLMLRIEALEAAQGAERWSNRVVTPGAPTLLFISSGAAEANRAMELASPVLLDDAFRIGRLFGASGTPSAVLIDRQGRVASGVVVGGPAVLGLAGITEERNERTV